MLYALLVTLLPFVSQSQQISVASFGESSSSDLVIGDITVTQGQVTVSLDLTEAINNPDSVFTEECLSNSMTWHIHDTWTHDTNDWKSGSTDCGSAFTSGHYDPWLACGAATANTLCEAQGGCVPGSSSSDYGTYTCDTSSYEESPYYCEVGDWSGKYGSLSLDSNNMLTGTYYSPFEVNAGDLIGKSVVFHCTGGARMFCAPFTLTNENTVDSPHGRPEQTDVTTLYADFSDSIGVGYIELSSDGSYQYGFASEEEINCEICKSSDLSYYIFEEWNSIYDSLFDMSGDKCMEATGGYTWDPTVSCLDLSGNEYCTDNYPCDSTDAYSCDYTTDPYSCAPGDLSGKYGTLDVNSWNSEIPITEYGFDRTMPDLYTIKSYSVGIVCGDTIVACARFKDVSVATATATFCPSDSNSNIEGSIVIENNEVIVDLDISGETSIDESCFSGGLGWHVHEMWTHTDNEARTGATDCGAAYTGGHYDPYTACGPATGNDYCSSCSIDSSSYVPSFDGVYTCNTESFADNPFVCEIGDLSGKYGSLTPVSGILQFTGESQYAELRGTDLIGKAIVFHCNDGSRTFCAPFIVEGTDGKDVNAYPALNDNSINNLKNEGIRIDFGSNNYIEVWSNGKYIIELDISGECESEYATLSLYDSCKKNKEYFDPGFRCPPQSCSDECECINNSGYIYNCDINERYSCSVGDLGGKWGYLKTSGVNYMTGYDYTLPPLTDLIDLSVNIECLDGSYTSVDCEGFRKNRYHRSSKRNSYSSSY
jgi:hypothetical protein